MQTIKALVSLAVGKRTQLLENMAKAKTKTLGAVGEDATELVVLLQQEAKKRKYATMVNLLMVIKYSFVDSEACMKRLARAGLGAVLLNALKLLRHVSEGRWLELFLTNLADLSEWDFLVAQHRKAFMEEVLALIEHRYSTCDLIATEAMGVVMALFSSNKLETLNDMRSSGACFPILVGVVYNIAKIKSFHLQALIVEFIYRAQRLLRNKNGTTENELSASLLQNLPASLAKGIHGMAPKTSDTNSSMSLDLTSQPHANNATLIIDDSPQHTVKSSSKHSEKTEKPCMRGENGEEKLFNKSIAQLAPQDAQHELLAKLKLLANAVLEQQCNFRNDQIDALCRQTQHTFTTQASQHMHQIQTRVHIGSMESSLAVALEQHRETMALLSSHQRHIAESLDASDVAEDELLQATLDLKHTTLEGLRSKWSEQLRPLQKKSDASRCVRRGQLENKLREISTKFDSSDLIAMQAMLGRI
ncbi:hypothetical protein ACHHYP_15648 [Achlya hypogyna]|uniref:Uncharacterized protein n=1 Tax=Achlya hypogyna TaxID=1202772 RepID=A0A1V9YAD7_ACHHY|nr:hypothetical protein ACHHYP_15648 [Achlya hypogyna]